VALNVLRDPIQLNLIASDAACRRRELCGISNRQTNCLNTPKKSYLSSSYCQKYLPYFIHYFQYQTVLALRSRLQKSPQRHVLHSIRDIGRVGELLWLA